MIVDIFTKNSHYRADDLAQTVECIGPVPFAPHKVDNVTLGLGRIVAGRRMSVGWADGRGPSGEAYMHTSVVERVQWQRPESRLDPKVATAAEALNIPAAEAVKIVDSATIPECLLRPAKAARLRELMEDEGMSRAEARAMIVFETT